MSARRIFWGRSLAQAVAKAARHYKVAPEQLAWKQYEKRHGFVRHQRAALVEVDPAAPLRAPDAPAPRLPMTSAAPLAPTPMTPMAPTTSSAPAAPNAPETRRSEPAPAPRAAASSRPPKMVAPRNEEPFDAPDEETERAALEAISRLLRFAAIEAHATAARTPDRLEIALVTAPTASDGAPREIGGELLDDFEHLVPKAILTLTGRRVRVAVDFGGQREARAEALRAEARELAALVRASGESRTLGPLTPAERRVVHLEFERDPEIATESEGDGHRKRVRLVPRRGV